MKIRNNPERPAGSPGNTFDRHPIIVGLGSHKSPPGSIRDIQFKGQAGVEGKRNEIKIYYYPVDGIRICAGLMFLAAVCAVCKSSFKQLPGLLIARINIKRRH